MRAAVDRMVARLRAALGEPLEKSLRRRLRAAAPATLEELREDLHCRITGTALALDGHTLEAPFTGLRCIAYLVEVISTRDGASELVVYDKRAVPFVIEELGHRAVVEPTHFELVVAAAHESRKRAGTPIGARERAMFDRYRPTYPWSAAAALHVRELLVEQGTRISIAGTGHREADPDAQRERGYRELAQQRLRFIGTKQLPLLIGDEV